MAMDNRGVGVDRTSVFKMVKNKKGTLVSKHTHSLG